MSSAFVLLTLLFSSTFALTPISRPNLGLASVQQIRPSASAAISSSDPKPLCFTPPDLHEVSQVVSTCAALLDDFIVSFGERMNDRLRWTGNNSESGQGMVHLPQVATRRNREHTGACLVEVVDRGNGDNYSASSIRAPGLRILNECFSEEKCGEVALPPHGTTTLALCGTYSPNGTSLLRRPIVTVSDSGADSRPVTVG